MFTDSAIHPIRVHYDAQYASIAAKVLGWMEQSWDIETRSLATGGLEFPPPAGDGGTGGDTDRLDVYMEPSGFGGYYCPELYVFYSDAIATSGFISINPDLNDDAFTSAAVAHELHHAIQFAIDAHEDPSFMEMTSAYVMEVVFDQADAASAFIPEFQSNPHRSLDYFSYGEPYQYGASLWLFWMMDELYGSNGHEALRYIWYVSRQPFDGSTIVNEPDYFDSMADLLDGSELDLDETYADFAADRWFTGDNDDGTFTEGGGFPEPSLANSFNAGNLPEGMYTLGEDTSEYGVSYVRIHLDEPSDEATLAVTWDLDPGVSWSVLSLRSGTSADRSVIGTSPAGSEILAGLEADSDVVLAFVNQGDGDHDPDNDDWGGSAVAFSAEYDDPADSGGDDGAALGCGCALGGRGTPRAAGSSVLVAAFAGALLLRRRSRPSCG